MADEDFGFGGGGDGGGGDDFGFGDDFGEALDAAEQSADGLAEGEAEALQATFAQLPEAEIEHEAEAEEEYEEAEDDEEEVAEVARKRTEEKITGKKTGWMKMMKASKGFATLGKKAWQEKWFILEEGKFSITSGPGPAGKSKMQTIDLTHALAFEKDPGDDTDLFSLVTKSKTFFFKTRSPKDCVSWVANLTKAKANYLGSFSSGSTNNSSMLF